VTINYAESKGEDRLPALSTKKKTPLSVGGKCNPNPVSVVFNIAVWQHGIPRGMRMLMAMMMKMCGK
jgi:hypothetical protein